MTLRHTAGRRLRAVAPPKRGATSVACVAVLLALVVMAPWAPPTPSDEPDSYERIEVSSLSDPAETRALLESLGATIEVESHGRIQALVPTRSLPAVHDASHLLRVERPGLWVPVSEAAELALVGADRWQEAGFSGHGTSIAVLDSGFEGYEDALGNTLPEPPSLVTRSFRSDESLGGTDHGRRAAEVVHSIAPGAELHLLNFSTVTELSAAVDYLVEAQVDIVSFSLGYIHNGPGDGTGPVNDIVSRSLDAGLTWAVASGNWAQQHWSGTFEDRAGDSVHEFAPGQARNGRFYQAGDLVTVSLRWDDEWGAACSDYDLELFDPDGALIRASRTVQDCSGDPIESLQVLATQSGVYEARIIQAEDDAARRLNLMMVGAPDRGHALEFFTPQGSLSEPADHPGVISVGATNSEGIEAAYSSRGPTTDGRLKPEIVAPTAASPTGSQGFAGTSAAAPHVAGVLGLFKEAFPGADRGTLSTALRARAIVIPTADKGTPGLRRVDTGTLEGLGPTLPPGAQEAVALGDLPDDGGLALLAYRGPDAYPLRFAHHLVEGRPVVAAYRLRSADRAWEVYLRDAPGWVNTLTHINDGQILIFRVAAP